MNLRGLRAVITDIDGVVLDTPHALAWRRALEQLATRCGGEANRLDAAGYRRRIAGRSREVGARAALQLAGLPADEQNVTDLCAIKQGIFEQLVGAGRVRVYPDAGRLLRDCHAEALPVAAASSSRNVKGLLARLPAGPEGSRSIGSLYDGQPHWGEKPAVFAAAADGIGLSAADCVVVEDAPTGVAAAKAGGFSCVGIARDGGAAELVAAGADLVIETLDDFPRPLNAPFLIKPDMTGRR
jgi:beta-phosphoglucomutase-like phosphatase (HAD superfamily)